MTVTATASEEEEEEDELVLSMSSTDGSSQVVHDDEDMMLFLPTSGQPSRRNGRARGKNDRVSGDATSKTANSTLPLLRRLGGLGLINQSITPTPLSNPACQAESSRCTKRKSSSIQGDGENDEDIEDDQDMYLVDDAEGGVQKTPVNIIPPDLPFKAVLACRFLIEQLSTQCAPRTDASELNNTFAHTLVELDAAQLQWNELRLSHATQLHVLRSCIRDEREDAIQRHAHTLDRLRMYADNIEGRNGKLILTRAIQMTETIERGLTELNPYITPGEPPPETDEPSLLKWLGHLAPGRMV